MERYAFSKLKSWKNNPNRKPLVIRGARQVGKSTVLKQLMDDNREEVLLDDIEERKLASKDPALFLQMHSLPILIDEVQYAPELFSYIKMAIDKGAAPGSFWLTGSQPFKLMELAQETLAGRIAIIHMPPLSQHEIYGNDETEPFSIDLDKLKKRYPEGFASERSIVRPEGDL